MSHADAIAWLASAENTDKELREQARDVLDTLAFYEYCRRSVRGAAKAPISTINKDSTNEKAPL